MHKATVSRILAACLVLALALVAGCSSARPAEPVARTIALVGGKPDGGPQRIEAAPGAKVTLTFTADTEDTIHVHGYEIELAVAPGKPVVADFVADKQGTYEIETHKSGNIIAQLVVR